MATASTPADLATIPTETAQGNNAIIIAKLSYCCLWCYCIEKDETLLIKNACTHIMEDYDSSHETSKAIIDMASALMGRLEHPQAQDLKFF